MRTANRYLVRWRSSATGQHAEAYTHEARAEERLEELSERAYFEAGAVVDTAGATSTPEEFISRHREHHRMVTA